jgi:hypothetical protein
MPASLSQPVRTHLARQRLVRTDQDRRLDGLARLETNRSRSSSARSDASQVAGRTIQVSCVPCTSFGPSARSRAPLILTRYLSFSEPQRPKRQMSLGKRTILMASSSPTANPHIRRTAQALPLLPSLEARRSRPKGHPALSNPPLYQRLTISTSRRSLTIAFDLYPFNPAEVRLAFLVMLIQWSAWYVHRCCFNCVACRQLVPTTDHLRSAARARLLTPLQRCPQRRRCRPAQVARAREPSSPRARSPSTTSAARRPASPTSSGLAYSAGIKRV